MKVSKSVYFSSCPSNSSWLYPVNQRMISSTSVFLRPFFSALVTKGDKLLLYSFYRVNYLTSRYTLGVIINQKGGTRLQHIFKKANSMEGSNTIRPADPYACIYTFESIYIF
jgi:hypothetical protein